MYFITQSSWEIQNPVQRAFLLPGSRIYPIVEVAINCALWHVDVLNDVSGTNGIWERFIIPDLRQVLALLGQSHSDSIQIHFQSAKRTQSSAPYVLHQVKRITSATTADGGQCHVIACGDGNQFVQPDIVSMGELQEHTRLYDCDLRQK